MPDAKTQVSVSDHSRITADQEREVSNLAQKYGFFLIGFDEMHFACSADCQYHARESPTTA